MLIKTRGIVFKAIKYSETSVITDIYTEEKGLRKYIVKGVRSKKSRISASLLQVMSIVDLVAYERADRDMHYIREIKSSYVFQSVPFNVTKGAIGLFMAELARKTIREPEEHRVLFLFLVNAFQFLDQTNDSVANLPISFLLELSGFLGFMADDNFSDKTPFFDLREGIFAPAIPMGHTNYLDEVYSELLHCFLQSDMVQAHNISINREQRRNLLTHLLDYYKLHIERLPEINSHIILREVLG